MRNPGDEEHCHDILVIRKFGRQPIHCPECGTGWLRKTNRDFRIYRCTRKNYCHYQINVATLGTVFAGTHVSLDKWFHALYILQMNRIVTPGRLAKLTGMSRHGAMIIKKKLLSVMY